MHIITVTGLAVAIGLSFMVDGNGTVKLVIAIVTIRGITWIAKTVVSELDYDKAKLINFTGWSLALVSGIQILKNAIVGVEPIVNTLGKIGDFFGGIYAFLDKLNQFADKITPWN